MSGSTTGTRLLPLKPGLGPEKRALAEDLRGLFLTLDVSVRRYAARRHLNASSVTRYLSGERVPPWDFVAGVIVDSAEETERPLTTEAEDALRELHRAALKAGRRNSEVQQLQDRLADTDEEIRRIKTRARALEEALGDRNRRLSDLQRRCLRAEQVVEEQRLVHSAELERWEGEYERLHTERQDLREQVLFLEEALAVARAELIAAEEECYRLESELEASHESENRVAAPSLMEALEATDRTATVTELVDLVTGLETRTQHAIASELVTSASRSREIAEVSALLTGLYTAGLHHHAEAALPAMVMMRPVADVAGLIAALSGARLRPPVVTLLQASVRLHTPQDVAGLAGMLHTAGLADHAVSLLGAAAVTRPLPDVMGAIGCLRAPGFAPLVRSALSAAACQRPLREILRLLNLLFEDGLGHLVAGMTSVLAAKRTASDVAEFLAFAGIRGLDHLREAALAETEQRDIAHLTDLIYALQRTGNHTATDAVLLRAVACRAPADVAVLINDLHVSSSFHESSRALVAALANPSAAEVRALVGELDRGYAGADAVLKGAARVCTPGSAAAMAATLEACGLHEQAETLFRCFVDTKPAGHCGMFLQGLHLNGAPSMTAASLRERAWRSTILELAQLIRALGTPALRRHLDVVLLACATARSATDHTLLLKNLRDNDTSTGPRAERVVNRLLEEVVVHQPVPGQVDLLLALAMADLGDYARHLEVLATRTEQAAAFTKLLKATNRQHEQRPLSRSFWRSKRP
ncbi:hypothetical protein [Streptomyces melanogenes]|uniref:hypothetical protein n=1 Tax=Streptomyces melanogenes TaxID=67326 RepID=UPI0037A7D935